MSIASSETNIEYPESDGKPMGETDWHRDWMVRIHELLRHRYREQRVYVASDLLLYYEEGHPTRFVVPDNFVVLDCDPGRRRVFKTWTEKRVPDVIIEVTSRSTSSGDQVDKPLVYEAIGVHEYFLYDPLGSYLEPALQGFRNVNGVMTEIKSENGRLKSERLGIDLGLDGNDLIMVDSMSQTPLLSEAEAERQKKEAAEDRIRELENEIRRLKGDA